MQNLEWRRVVRRTHTAKLFDNKFWVVSNNPKEGVEETLAEGHTSSRKQRDCNFHLPPPVPHLVEATRARQHYKVNGRICCDELWKLYRIYLK